MNYFIFIESLSGAYHLKLSYKNTAIALFHFFFLKREKYRTVLKKKKTMGTVENNQKKKKLY